ncbi:bleomycin resistance protein [Streptomyces boncukensis]|uniref:VOC family protein n=1 Tax=Streptomyces boncukensis TaxID=2711219 RepID=A0A6G4X2N6_9ACTN|nr:VOC family protein [Streptomyces boncukensis]NGO71004.1 VOC family protein [Streptomyces boncukensis]
MTETTTPILPCRTIQPILDFYEAVGFAVTFVQRSPNPYAAVERGGIQLQFFGMKDYDPRGSYSTCYVTTDDVDALYADFRSRLKAAYGRVPTRGLPRIGALRDTSFGMRQFLLNDPGGNCVRIGQPISDDQRHAPAPKGTFARALHHAALFADSKLDLAGAARVLDRALAREDERPTRVQLFRLLVLRADVAARLGEDGTARRALDRAAAVELAEDERAEVRDDLVRLRELRG